MCVCLSVCLSVSGFVLTRLCAHVGERAKQSC